MANKMEYLALVETELAELDEKTQRQIATKLHYYRRCLLTLSEVEHALYILAGMSPDAVTALLVATK